MYLIVEAEVVECECASDTPSLAVLKDVQKAYEHRIELLERVPYNRRLPVRATCMFIFLLYFIGALICPIQ